MSVTLTDEQRDRILSDIASIRACEIKACIAERVCWQEVASELSERAWMLYDGIETLLKGGTDADHVDR